MKNNKFSYNYLSFFLMAVLGLASCTKLDETLSNSRSLGTDASGVGTPGSINGLYNSLNQLLGQGNAYAMQEHTTDEILGPTRGTDWDDFGTWRKLHLHTWDGSHNQINDTWNGITGAVYQATLVAETASGQTKAEAQFIRAYLMYQLCDLFGQVPYIPATALPSNPGTVLNRSAAFDFILADLDAAIAVLPAYTHGTRDKATKEAAQFLEAKIYLNKAVYKTTGSPAGPFTFDAADMNKVITLTDAISTNAALTVSTDYWDNFRWDNGVRSTENIFVRPNQNMRWASYMGAHYNMAPSGWNGFTTLADFYNSFDNGDTRKSDTIRGTIIFPGSAANPVDNSLYWDPVSMATSYIRIIGHPAGFLAGTQKGPASSKVGKPLVNLKDRSGNPLQFTPDVSLFFSTETKGIRTNKYPLDPQSLLGADGSSSANEFVFFRFSDARLMKAEAILRGGSATGSETPVGIVNGIRSNRNAVALSAVDLTTLLAERGRELYLEAWRRNDLIRYGTFNNPVGERPSTSAAARCIFPIPNIALSSNPGLKQNPGY